MAEREIKYMVMSLKKDMELLGQKVKVQGCAGYFPVFDSEEEANIYSENGKFSIVPIEIKE